MADEVLDYIEKRLAYLGRLYGQRLRQIDAHDFTPQEKEAWKADLWAKTNARTDELKRMKRFANRNANPS
jgi:hypothetical protein